MVIRLIRRIGNRAVKFRLMMIYQYER